MSPVPDTVLPPEKDDDMKDNKTWSNCPDCRSTMWTIAHKLTGPWSMHQVCADCGCVDEKNDLHFLAGMK